MSVSDITDATDPDLHLATHAMKRAAKEARAIAMKTKTNLVVVENGLLRKIPADQLRKEDSTLEFTE